MRGDGGDDGATVELTRERVDTLASAYGDLEPFDLVEREHVETLPSAFADGDFGRRDAEWPVQWYHRRGTTPDDERRDAEARIRDNDHEELIEAVRGAAAAGSVEAKVGRLTALAGVDVPVASAFLAFMHPDAYVAVGEREWRVLADAGELDRAYPGPLAAADYAAYLDAVRGVAARIDRDVWTVYRALWRLGAD